MEDEMKKLSCYFSLIIYIVLTMAILPANAIEIKMPFVFIEQFEENSSSLDFPQNKVLQIGALIKSDDIPITKVNAKNLDTGLMLEAKALKPVDKFFHGIYMVWPMPVFEQKKHLGLWEITVIDEKGNKVSAKTHKLDRIDNMPYLTEIKTSGNPLTPTISWKPPDSKDIPSGCKTGYYVRLIKDINTQLHRSKPLQITNYIIPEGTLKDADLADTYVRIELFCIDSSEPEDPLALELRSSSFSSLKEALK